MDVAPSGAASFCVGNHLLCVAPRMEVPKVAAVLNLIAEGHDWVLAGTHHPGRFSQFFADRIERLF